MRKIIWDPAICCKLSGVSMVLLAATIPSSNAAPSSAAPVEQVADNSNIEEIVVTARRKKENIQNVPIAVTTINPLQLEEKSIVNAADVQFSVPSLQVNGSATYGTAEPTFTLRGLSTTNPGTNADAAVATYFDEIPVSNTRQIAHSLYDLESIQVARGPQGTLYGKNSTGGAIIFTPQKPTQSLEGLAQLELGDYDLRQLTAVLNVPLGDKADIRLATRDLKHDAYEKNISGSGLYDGDYRAGRVTLEVRPIDAITDDLMLDASKSDEQAAALEPTAFGPLAFLFYGPTGILGPASPSLNQQLANQVSFGPNKVDSPLGNPLKIDTFDVTNTTTVQLADDLSFKNIVGFEHQNTKEGLTQGNEPTPLLLNNLHDVESQTSEEFQVLGKSFDRRLDWILGTIYVHQDEDERIRNHIFGPIVADSIYDTGSSDSNAVFGQATYDLGALIPSLNFTAGYRYTWDSKALDTIFQNPAPVCVLEHDQATPPTIYSPCLRSLSATFKAPNWTVGFDYHVTDKIMVYVASRRGYKAGGFNGTSQYDTGSSYSPEKITDVEIGTKTQFDLWGMSSRVNVALYHADYDNPTVAPIVALGGGASGQLVENVAAGATIQGGELEWILRPMPAVQLSASYSLVDGHYNSGATYLAGFNGPTPFYAPLGGSPVYGSSRSTVEGSANYDFSISPDVGDLMGEVDFAWRGKQTLPGFPPSQLPAFGIVNLRVDWRDIYNTNLDFGVWVKNVTDRTYIVNQQILASVLGVDNNSYGPPRTIGVDITYHW